ncbi:MAG: hypothetical protein N3F10_05260 [Candidatus Bathyarchaeota archaeon]|nr:hypothetical protein [Candidatus Bathyarchaeota archaeon]MCX8177687.1 hypothetical protein [Candidatus Bathyarchaeota archaeon]MDW8193947.1 hypothetical protein [Nitrososphaerota archaeon]
MEHCKNPWKKGCKNDNVEVYIMLNGDKLPICKSCWSEIAKEDLEW